MTCLERASERMCTQLGERASKLPWVTEECSYYGNFVLMIWWYSDIRKWWSYDIMFWAIEECSYAIMVAMIWWSMIWWSHDIMRLWFTNCVHPPAHQPVLINFQIGLRTGGRGVSSGLRRRSRDGYIFAMAEMRSDQPPKVYSTLTSKSFAHER